MRLSELAGMLELDPTRVHEWTTAGVVLPVSPAKGRGKHSEYDDASAVAAAVVREIEALHVVARRYAEGFAKLHVLLRARSSLEWSQMIVELTPTEAMLIEPESERDGALAKMTAAVRVDLAKVCAGLIIDQQQQTLKFALRSA